MEFSIKKLWHMETFSSLSIMGIRVGMLAAKFLLTIFIARYMGLEEVGIYGLIIGVGGTIQSVLRMGVFNIMARDAVHQTPLELASHIRHYATGIICFYIVLLPVAYVFGYTYNHVELALLAIAVLVTEHFAFDIFLLVNNLEKPKLANILLSLQSASWIYLYIAFALIFPALRTLENVMLFWVIGGAATVAFAVYLSRDWPWQSAFEKPLNWQWYKDIIVRSRHNYVADVVSVLTLYMDRYLITIFLSLKLTGVYILFSQVENAIVNLVTSGVMQVYVPKLIAAFKENDTAKFKAVFKNSVIRTLGSTAALGILSAIALPFLIMFTSKPEATQYLPLFWLMMVALLIRMSGSLARSMFYPMHMDRQNLRTAILMMVLTTVSITVCLNLFGIYGIVVSTIIISCLITAYVNFVLRKIDFWSR